MNFENWVTGTYSNDSLNAVVASFGPAQGLRKMHKALNMADALLTGETVTALAVGKFASFGESVLVVTTERVLIVKNSFQAGFTVSFGLDALESAHFSHVPLMGHSLALEGGAYRFSRIPAEFVAGLREVVSADRLPHYVQAA